MNEMTTKDLQTSIWWNPYTIEHISLKTPLSADECIKRIRENIYFFWSGSNPSLPFGGTAKGNRFTLFKNTPHFRNAFRPMAKGVLLSGLGDTDTTISVRLSLATFARLWWSILLIGFIGAFLLFYGVAQFINLGPGLSDPFNRVGVIIAALGVGCMFYPFYLLAFWPSRNERVFLIETLVKILDASDLYSDLYTSTSQLHQ